MSQPTTRKSRPRAVPKGIRELPSGTWQVTISRPNGRRETATFPPDQLAEAIAHKAREEAMKGNATRGQRRVSIAPARGMTVRAYYGEWIARRSAENSADPISPATLRNYKCNFDNWILPLVGSLPVREMDRHAVRRVADSMGTLSRASQRAVMVSLSAMLTDAVRRDVLAANPVSAARAMPRRAEETEARRVLTEAEAIRCMEAAPRDAFTFLVLWSTGARINEARGLRMADVDLATWRVRIADQLHVRDGRKATKSGRGRFAPVSRALATALADRVDDDPRAYLLQETDGRPVGYDQLRRRWQALRVKLELEARPCPPTLHSFRHGAITHWLASGVPITQARDWAGHSSLSVTNTYAHSLPGLEAGYAALI